jgi:hypothetical protein
VTPRSGKLGRLRQLWEIIARDPTALTEVVGGFLLVAFRGFLLISNSQLLGNHEVAALLGQIHVTENRWGSYLIACGCLQIVFAGTRHYTIQALVTAAILLGFMVMGAGFWLVGGWHAIPPSVVCMAAVYIYLLGRLLADRKAHHEAHDL